MQPPPVSWDPTSLSTPLGSEPPIRGQERPVRSAAWAPPATGAAGHTARMCPAGAVTVTADTRLPRVPYRVVGRGQGGAGRWRGGHRPACGRLPGSSSSTNGQRDLWEARDSPAPRHRPRPAGLCPLHVSGGLCPQTLSPTLSPTATASPVIVPRPFIVPGPRPPSSACVLLKDLERPSGQAAKDVSTELD